MSTPSTPGTPSASGGAGASGDGARPRGPSGSALRVLAVVAALLVVGSVFGVRSLRERQAALRALPPVSGSLQAEGLAAEMTVRRDERGVPHVEAESDADAWFGLGFVHAQDRLSQMLWLRRLARGTVSEWVGPETLAWDRLARTIGFAHHAERQLGELDADAKALLERYAAGVEARLERIRSGEIAPPLALGNAALGPTPSIEGWTPLDSLAVWNLVAFQSGAPLAGPLVLEDLVQRLGGGGARIFAPFPELGGGFGVAGTLPQLEESPSEAPPQRILDDADLGSVASIFGGRVVAVAAKHTASGAPLVAVSYDLAPRVPSLFHQSHVLGEELDAAGVAVPGVPIYLAGRNARVAWALTPAPILGLDLYRETLRGADAELRYNDGLRWLAVETRDETISARAAPDEVLRVQSTRHGPLIQPLLTEPREPLAAAWVGARSDDPFGPLSELASVEDVPAALAALEGYDGIPLHAVAADVDDRVEARIAGWVPRRRLPTGMSPVPGRTRHFDWRGRVHVQDLHGFGASASPAGKSPLPIAKKKSSSRSKKSKAPERLRAKDFVVVADEAASFKGSPTVEWLWQRGESDRRLRRLLQQAITRGDVDLRDIAAIQRDRLVPGGPLLAEAAIALAGEEARLRATLAEVADLLAGWDGVADVHSRGATAYHLFLDDLVRELFEPRLGPELLHRYRALRHSRADLVARELVVRSARAQLEAGWLDRDLTQAAVLRALRRSWAALGNRLGPNRSRWEWGRLHRVRFQPFVLAGRLEGPSGLRERGIGGALGTLNSAAFPGEGDFEVDRATTVLVGVDLGAAGQLTTTVAPGQTEHPSDRYFAHGVEPWVDGLPTLVLTTRLLVDAGQGAQLLLEPAR